MSAPSQDAQPTMACPKCGHEQPDFDGLGFPYCDECGYCDHRTQDLINGQWICGGCEKWISNEPV